MGFDLSADCVKRTANASRISSILPCTGTNGVNRHMTDGPLTSLCCSQRIVLFAYAVNNGVSVGTRFLLEAGYFMLLW